jgi:serine/threonine protein kinase
LKAENILINSESNIKLIDFGSAAKIDPNNLMRGKIGTAVYCAPEVARESGTYSEKCDMWSLGVLIYFLLTRNYPFEGNNDNETLRIIIRTNTYPR